MSKEAKNRETHLHSMRYEDLSIKELIGLGGRITYEQPAEAPMPRTATDYVIEMPDGEVVYKTAESYTDPYT